MRIALAASLALLACGGTSSHSDIPAAPTALTAAAVDGGTIDVTRYRGRIVVLHFFTTWDGGSQSDVEQLKALAEVPDVVVIGVALEPDGRRLVAPWRKAMGVRHLIGLGGPELSTNVPEVKSVPTTVILDTAGVARARFDRPLRPGELSTAIGDIR